MSRLSKLLACGFLLLLGYGVIRSCGAKKNSQDGNKNAFIASVGKQYLYASDLEPLGILCTDAADRASLMNQYVEEWACKQLLIAQGAKDYPSAQSAIESKLHAYKNDLLAYYFLENLIQSKLDRAVSQREIEDYYQKHKQDDFILHHDIVQGIFLAIPKRAVGINSVKSLMLSTKAADRKKLKAYCKPYPSTTILEADKWFAWEAVLAKVGYCPLGDATRLLKTNKFIHVAGRKYIYLLKINQYKIAEEMAPLEAVEERIRAIILHKRKLSLINKIKNNLLRNAKENHTCVIYTY